MAAFNILQVVKFAMMTWGVVPRWIRGTNTNAGLLPSPKVVSQGQKPRPSPCSPSSCHRLVSCQCRDQAKHIPMACPLQVTQCAELGPGPIPRSTGERELAYRQAAGRAGVILTVSDTVSEREPRWRPEGIPAGAAGPQPPLLGLF